MSSRIHNSSLKKYNPVIIRLAQEAGSIKALAKAMGMHWVGLHAWARGKQQPDFWRLEPLGHHAQANAYTVQACGLTLAQIFQPDNAPPDGVSEPDEWQSRHIALEIAPGSYSQEAALNFALDLPKLMAKLSARQKIIILERLQGASQEEVGELCGVSHQRIAQQEADALRKLRRRCLALGIR